ncbi:MAG TPA: hypothetical protein DCX53_00260 [Anaerolineae bacterium]|nr:hypothetical protein [Anaerolineae bacterium]
MRSLFEKKPWVLLLAILALGALTVLSVSLRSVSFNDPQPIGREEADPLSGPPRVLLEPLTEEAFQAQIILWVALAILLVLIGILLSPEVRKRLIRIIIRTAFTLWALYFILKRYPDLLSFLNFGFDRNSSAQQTEGELADLAPPVFIPPQETAFLSYLVSMIVVLIALFIMWRLYRAWRELNPGGTRSLHEIARVARASLRELSDGRESTDVILNCYFRMSDVVADKRNIQREAAMTPGEFALRLERSGLPSDAVRRLTRLFEGVRYGSQKAGPKETNEAVACLRTILQYCGEPV